MKIASPRRQTLRRFAIRAMVGLMIAAPLVLPTLIARGDTIETTAGASINGKVVARDDKVITIEVVVGGKPVQRKYPVNTIRAVTIDGKREVLGPGGAAAPAANGANVARTTAEVNALIAKSATPPDWLATTKLNLPASLDMSWPEKPPPPWNNQKNIGQFVWDVINTNPNRWREGVALMHKIMDDHKGDKDMQSRAAMSLGNMYHNLFQDYARAAYWWRQAGTRQDQVGLAECYWKLGNKQMALAALGGSIQPHAIKLLGDMGEPDKALAIAARYQPADIVYLYAGDACRTAGRFQQAIQWYEKVLAMKDDNRNKRGKDQARGRIEAIKLFDTLDVKKVADGTYTASSLGYEAQVEVEVKVAGGKIEDCKVTKHHEKQYYASITDTPAQIIRKQSVKGIDATSRATITSEAIITATAKALQQGMK
jgi:uncharacterized protein with FMN-binding domain